MADPKALCFRGLTRGLHHDCTIHLGICISRGMTALDFAFIGGRQRASYGANFAFLTAYHGRAARLLE